MAIPNKMIGSGILELNNLLTLGSDNKELLKTLNTIIKNEKNLYAQIIEIVNFLNLTYFNDSNSGNFRSTPINGKVSSVSITNGKLIVSYYLDGAVHDVIYYLDVTTSQYNGESGQHESSDLIPGGGDSETSVDTTPGSKVIILSQYSTSDELSPLEDGEDGDYAYAEGHVYVWSNDNWTQVENADGIYIYDRAIYEYNDGDMTLLLEQRDVTPAIVPLKRWENYASNLILTGNTVGDYGYIINGVYRWNGSSWDTPNDYPTFYIWNNTVYERYNINKLKVVVQGETKEVIACSKWGGNAPSGSTTGAYIMTSDNPGTENETNQRILKGEGGTWVYVGTNGTPLKNTLYIDTTENIAYYWNGNTFIPLISASSDDEESDSDPQREITIDEEIVDPYSIGVPTTKAVTEYVAAKIAEDDENGGGFGEPDFDDPLRPEYWLEIDGQRVRESNTLKNQIKWGLPFYDFPLRCYNGTIDTSAAGNNGRVLAKLNKSVFAPADRIIYNMFHIDNTDAVDLVAINTNNVKYATNRKAFVLEYNGSIYLSWDNADEWNDPKTFPTSDLNSVSSYNNIKARKDRLYSDISKADPTEETKYIEDIRRYKITTTLTQASDISALERVDYDTRPLVERSFSTNIAQRTTKLFGWNETNDLSEDIAAYMTDFTKAIVDCVAANNGSMRLSNRIYYMGDIQANSTHRVVLEDKSNFTIDFGKGVLFARRQTVGVPPRGIFNNTRYAVSNSDVGKTPDMSTLVTYTKVLRGGREGQTYTRYEIDATKLKAALIYASNHNSLPVNVKISRMESTDQSTSIFSIKRCSNGTFRNITIRALRDADNGAPSGHLRFSSSDSRLKAFGLTRNYTSAGDTVGIKNLLFENLDIQGMYEDFNCSGQAQAGYTYIEDINILGWKSDGMQNSIRGYNWNVERAIIKQPNYLGSGIHIIYSQGTPSKGISFRDCEFHQGDGTSVAITYHGAKRSRDWHFTNCSFYGNLMFQGKDYRGWTTFENCYFEQLGKTASSDDNHHTQVIVSRFLGSFGHNITFENCRIHQLTKYLVSKGVSTYVKVNTPSGNPYLRGYYEATFSHTTDEKVNDDTIYYVKVDTSVSDANAIYVPVDDDLLEEVTANEGAPKDQSPYWYVVSGKVKSPDSVVNNSKNYYIRKYPSINIFDTGITVPVEVSAPMVSDSSCTVLMRDCELNYDGDDTETRDNATIRQKSTYTYVSTKELDYLIKEKTSEDFSNVNDKIEYNRETLFGETDGAVDLVANLPITAALNSKYYVSDNNKIYQCTTEGRHGQLLIFVYNPQNQGDANPPANGQVDVTITMNSSEVITDSITATTTLDQDGVFEELYDMLQRHGYRETLWKNTEPGTYCRNGDYLRINAKYGGSGTQEGGGGGSSVTYFVRSKGIALSSRTNGPNPVNRIDGTNPTWDSGTTPATIDAAGLIGRLVSLESRVTELED